MEPMAITDGMVKAVLGNSNLLIYVLFINSCGNPTAVFSIFSPVLDDHGFDGSCFSRGEAIIVGWFDVYVKRELYP